MTTKTAQFTPGPWIVETTNTLPGECADNVHRLCYPGYRIHGICAIWNNTRTSKANATLIAAAPALYEALKALHSVLDQRMPDGRTLNQHLSQEVFECFYGPAIAARAAIAKAEGA